MDLKPGYKQTEVGVIPDDWEVKSLGKFVALQRGHDLTKRDRRRGEVPVMGSAGHNGFHDKALVRGPGVVLGRSGASFGQAHYCTSDYWPHNTALYVTDFLGNHPLSYKGEYHYRSGSTKQELKGAALDKFLLRKQGRTWDSVPVPYVTIRDLSTTAISGFRKLARQSRRLDANVRGESVAALIEKLNLLEGTYLKRAAVLLFHPDPERYITGAFVKVGYFRTESELLYHDEVHGDLFTQAQKTMEVLLSKYLKAAISYRGIHRVERLPVPEDALREALLNALIHRDYSVCAPIQIRVYDDRLSIWNPGELPEGWSLEKFLKQHSSRPFNPSVANAFFRAGEIEAWGRGIQRIFAACRESETPEPRILYEPGDLWFEFPYSAAYLEIIPGRAGRRGLGEEVGERVGERVGEKLTANQQRILELLFQHPRMAAPELAEIVGISKRKIEKNVATLKKMGRLQRIGPAKGGHWEVLK